MIPLQGFFWAKEWKPLKAVPMGAVAGIPLIDVDL
jgi:hypothetical protein